MNNKFLQKYFDITEEELPEISKIHKELGYEDPLFFLEKAIVRKMMLGPLITKEPCPRQIGRTTVLISKLLYYSKSTLFEGKISIVFPNRNFLKIYSNTFYSQNILKYIFNNKIEIKAEIIIPLSSYCNYLEKLFFEKKNEKLSSTLLNIKSSRYYGGDFVLNHNQIIENNGKYYYKGNLYDINKSRCVKQN